MADIRLFDISGKVKQLAGSTVTLEKEIQTLIEKNMEVLFGVKFLASEYVTDDGRMDSIGIDENHCPVIFEYKRTTNENVINQGLSYLSWLVEHKDSFKVLVIDKLGLDEAAKVDWSMPRVICIAGDFNKFDKAAVKSMKSNISLIKYRKFEKDLLMFEDFAEQTTKPIVDVADVATQKTTKYSQKTFTEHLDSSLQNIRDLYDSINEYILSLGDDITENVLKLYKAYKKFGNFVCLEIYNNYILLSLKLDTKTVMYEEGFSKDMSNTGHLGTGDVQLTIKTMADVEKAKALIDRAYNEN